MKRRKIKRSYFELENNFSVIGRIGSAHWLTYVRASYVYGDRYVHADRHRRITFTFTNILPNMLSATLIVVHIGFFIAAAAAELSLLLLLCAHAQCFLFAWILTNNNCSSIYIVYFTLCK